MGSFNIDFELPQIDEKETRKAVEAELEKALLYKTIGYDRREATITQNYENDGSQRTNVTADQTASIAIHNVDIDDMRTRHVVRVETAVYRLARKERELIIERYLTDPYVYDYEVYHGIMNISAKTYNKIRTRAFYKLAFILKIEVVKISEEKPN